MKEGVHELAAALLKQGPPFDPQQVGLERHQVFLTDREAIFVFEADAANAVNRLVKDTNFWGAAGAWKGLVAGPPQLAEEAYSWMWARPSDFLSFSPCPGPGDSDGGDLYAP